MQSSPQREALRDPRDPPAKTRMRRPLRDAKQAKSRQRTGPRLTITHVPPHNDLLIAAAGALHDAGCNCAEKELGIHVIDSEHVRATHWPGCRYLQADDSTVTLHRRYGENLNTKN